MPAAAVDRFELDITLTNETTERSFSQWHEPLEDWLTDDDDTPDFGAIFRACQGEYGRCQSSVYVDRADGPPKRVGWFFVSAQRYDDTGERYLRGAWVTVVRHVVHHAEAFSTVEVAA